MNSNFNQFIERILKTEGGYINHPKDPGGETNWGITKRVAQQNGYNGAMRELTREQAKAIYYTAFWQRYNIEQFPSALAYQFLDACINHGYGNAARMLQRALDVADDGVIGKQTLAALAQHSENDLLLLFNAERANFYTRLSTFATFGRGWTNRIAENLRQAAQDNTDPQVGYIPPDNA
ncbi:glycoside hydrolase family 108 protein [Kingella oralis]|jgi:hypothetical protein|uniref:glycoside hydrolase family 108 protein n=1 Tax=Kingella oralis TaxID=505 RepID=UPI0028EB5CF6|nr:glycoside hydrolase family 108 protein [Kingella oralis]